MATRKAKLTKQVTQHLIDCITIEDFFTSEHTNIRIGTFVFVFYDEYEQCYRAIRTFSEDDLLPYFEQQNKAPIGYGWVIGLDRVALTLFDGQELKDDGKK